MLLFLTLLPAILAESFWMTAELLRVDWREGCLTTASCSHPRFKIFKNMLSLKEEISISWPVSEDFAQDSSRPFVSHWARGAPENLVLSCQVVGTDPTYGFPRICDQTASIRVFDDKATDRNRRDVVTSTNSTSEEESGKKLVQIRASCFNVTLAVQKHTERCPWCPDPAEVTHIEQMPPEDAPSAFTTMVFMRMLGDNKIMPLSMLILAGIAVISSLGIACVLVAFLRLKGTDREISSIASPQPRFRSNLVKIPIRSNASREQTRPLTSWLSSSSKSEDTTTSPLESTSSMGTRSSVAIPSFRSGCTIPQKHLYHRISPNSSTESEQESGSEARQALDNEKLRLELSRKCQSGFDGRQTKTSMRMLLMRFYMREQELSEEEVL